ncbi:competence/damage-inducible protein A, partial [SCandidatus Aminicenantes bacterium Aminicenantia_JdfR_composite]|nr:competence/damage-inducible protein A [SCandidatus Aminicenantes bacterium Aminicenantia_JdfR_composite]
MFRLEAEIIAIGSELLTSHCIDTNSLYLIEKLNSIGIEVKFKTIVRDKEEDIIQCIKNAISRSQIIIATGGLGPTEDDITRECFSKALKRKLIYYPEIEEKIRERFRKRGLSMPLICKKQAYILEGAKVLMNEWGTAPGMKIKEGNKLLFILPGPPKELKPMFEKYIFHELKKLSKQFV